MTLRKWRIVPGRTWPAVAAALVAAGLWLAGATTSFENALRNIFFAAQGREASGQLHIVEMDAASLAALDRWPWPRRHYGEVVDRLAAAGARSITFDVDFSTPSEPAQDSRFAAAVARANGTVALPTFAQRAAQGDGRTLDALPIPALREHAALASVAVAPDRDGLLRRMPLGSMTAGIPRPSLAAHIAQRAGTVDEQIPLDLAIDPASIPRHSFVAIESGRFDPRQFAGKDVLIGATAIEMGDRYAVPRFGVLPGVIVQALAAETLYGGIPISAGGALPLLAAFALLIAITRARSKRAAALRGAIAALALIAGQWLVWAGSYILLDIVPALLAIGSAAAFTVAALFRAELAARRLHDPETGLPNRLAMIGEAHRAQFTIAAFVGGFERLHTVLGDEQAAELVRRISERLAIGSGDKTIYRIEERTLAWSCDWQDFELEQALAGLHALMRSPIEIRGRSIDVQMAFGVAEGGALAEAAHAASEALRLGERWQYHVATERAALERQVTLMGELDAALDKNEIDVLYQPKLHLESNCIGSVEALVRWDHPQRGYLRPDLFIPLAEGSDRIAGLTLYVLQRAIDDLRVWCADGHVVSAAVNISARLVASEAFISAAEALLTKSGVPRQRLIFEVTESATIADPAAAAAALSRFRDLGVAISMDDYGTGQSTLSYLKQLPLSELKIDRSFVQFAHRDHSDALLVRSTINLAHQLGLTVVAEGVEEPDCLEFLRQAGCDYAQGYLIGKPMSAGNIGEMLTVPAPARVAA